MLKIEKSLNNFLKLSQTERNVTYLVEDEVFKVEEDITGAKFNEETVLIQEILPQNVYYKRDNQKLRKTAANMLLNAVNNLHKISECKLTLRILDSYRTLKRQEEIFRRFEKEVFENEGLTGKALWDRVTQFVADPKLSPPHTTGGAVDVRLVTYVDNQEVDLGPGMEASETSYTWYDGDRISNEAKKNRKLLNDIMIEVGFVNLPTEWWHYSYGDKYWAAVLGINQKAFYGSIK